MKLNRWTIGVIATSIGLAAVVLSLKGRGQTTALKNEQPLSVVVPHLKPHERPAFDRDFRGPVCRSEPVGWVFGRMIGVNASAMKTFKPGPLPAAAEDGL